MLILDANGDGMLNVECDRWHSQECLESGSVLLESKEEKYEPLKEEDMLVQ